MSLTNLAVRVGETAAEGEHLRLEIEPMAGAKVFAAERRPRPFVGHAGSSVDMIDASTSLGRCGKSKPIILRQQRTLRQNTGACHAFQGRSQDDDQCR